MGSLDHRNKVERGAGLLLDEGLVCRIRDISQWEEALERISINIVEVEL